MTNENPNRPVLGVEPEDLDGHTIEQLSAYLDSGRTPPDPSIDSSPGCLLALDALERLRGLSPGLLAADAADEPRADEGWIANLLSLITVDVRAGRRIPLRASGGSGDLGITEGAVRGQIRAAENAIPGVVVGRCRLDGDVTEPGAPVRVRIDASVPYGPPIPDIADRLRAEAARRLSVHTDLNIVGVDVAVHDIRRLPAATEGER